METYILLCEAERGFYSDVFNALEKVIEDSPGDLHGNDVAQMRGLIQAARFAIERQRATAADVLVKADV